MTILVAGIRLGTKTRLDFLVEHWTCHLLARTRFMTAVLNPTLVLSTQAVLWIHVDHVARAVHLAAIRWLLRHAALIVSTRLVAAPCVWRQGHPMLLALLVIEPVPAIHINDIITTQCISASCRRARIGRMNPCSPYKHDFGKCVPDHNNIPSDNDPCRLDCAFCAIQQGKMCEHNPPFERNTSLCGKSLQGIHHCKRFVANHNHNQKLHKLAQELVALGWALEVAVAAAVVAGLAWHNKSDNKLEWCTWHKTDNPQCRKLYHRSQEHHIGRPHPATSNIPKLLSFFRQEN